ncbi:MAG: hypothetical protein HQL37_15715, partial [Alphaproteobacteria bacterium]|nr:hypothetical protein [Alphaproteobacteria bacterium]
VVVTEHGERKVMTKMEAMAKQLANKATSGDIRSTQLLLAIMDGHERRTEAETPPEPAPTKTDVTVIKQLYERLKRWDGDDE